MFKNISQLQREIYELYFKKGWFIIEPIERTKLKEKNNLLSQELQDLEE